MIINGRPVSNFSTALKAREARAARLWRVIPPEVARLAGEVTGGHARRAGASARGIRTLLGWPLPPLHQRAHGGRPPVRDPGTACHRLAAVTPADRARAGTAIFPALQS